jgi:hypothetical protein
MRAAIFNRDGDLVTVVDIPQWAVTMLKDGRCLRLPERIQPPTPAELVDPPLMTRMRAVSLRALNRTATALECDDDETALLVQAAFAPGQVHELQRRERNAEGRGALKLMNALQSMARQRRGDA